MLKNIENELFQIAIGALNELYTFAFYFSPILSILSGLLIPVAYFDKPERDDQDSTFRRSIIALSVVLFFIGSLANVTVPFLFNLAHELHGYAPVTLTFPISEYFLIPFFFLGIFAHVWVRRNLSGDLNKLKILLTKKTEVARDERTDVRSVRDYLPQSMDYDPTKYIKLEKGVFVGMGADEKPNYIPLKELQKQHADILGTTGAGKGVASGLILYQLIQAGEGVFVLDPKDDEWCPHLLKKACKDAKKPFHLIDLNQQQPQLDLLANATPEQIEELLVAGFSFAEKGDIADFYRIDDRKAARLAPLKATDEERKTFKGIFQSEYVKSIEEKVKAFYGKMEELSEIQSINSPDGLDLQEIFKNGGCCYVIGSLRNAKIIMAQKMILIRLFQLAEMRDRVKETPKPIAIFLDELKYHISKAAMEGLGAARDKGVHMFLAHQSVADLRDCPADLNGDAVVGAVVENTKFKLVYKLQDPETAEWVAKMSGTILVDDESRTVDINASLNEVVEGRRNIRMAERYFVDTNMLLNLPPFVSYIFTATEVPKPSLISPIKVKKQALEIFTPPSEKQKKHEIKKAESEVTDDSQSEEFEEAKPEPTDDSQSEEFEEAKPKPTDDSQSEEFEEAQPELTDDSQSEEFEEAQPEPTDDSQSEEFEESETSDNSQPEKLHLTFGGEK